MSAKSRVSILAAAIALALGGTAMASTTIDATTTGDLFVNVVDYTNSSSFLFDTGVTQAAFNQNGSYNFDFHSDPNYLAFATAAGSDALNYSVLSATKTTTSPNLATVLFTASQPTSPVVGSQIAQAQTTISGFLFQADQQPGSATSADLTAATGATWGQNNNEVTFNANLLTNDSAAPGSSLVFYSESSNALRSAQTPATLTTLAGTWNYAGGDATYSAVPLPTPVLLLLSGLGLMGAVARRSKAA